MIIELTKDEIFKATEFSYKCADAQQDIEFGQKDTVPRSIKEIGRDNLIGKLTEIAFAKMLSDQFGIATDLDFNYYPRGKWDKQDTVINNWRIDVKGTRQGGKWLLVEWSKLNFRQKEGSVSHLYVMGSVFWNREADEPTGKVDIVGCASIQKLNSHTENTLVLKKGELIPGTNARLQADNFAISFEHLQHDWAMTIKYILEHKPPDLFDYVSPNGTKHIAENKIYSDEQAISKKKNKFLQFLNKFFK